MLFFPFPSFACLLAQAENRLGYLVQRVLGTDQHVCGKQRPTTTSKAHRWVTGPTSAGPRVYRVRYQLTGAELRDGQVVASYVAPGVRLFETNELNVIWAELVDELGTSPYRLGLEILAIEAYC